MDKDAETPTQAREAHYSPTNRTIYVPDGNHEDDVILGAMGEYFLDFYLRNSGKKASIDNDLDRIMKWFKISGANANQRFNNWLSMGQVQQQLYRQKFGQALKFYLAEGSSPTNELGSTFTYFRNNKLSNSHSNNLTPEIREVLSRMLATTPKAIKPINKWRVNRQTLPSPRVMWILWPIYFVAGLAGLIYLIIKGIYNFCISLMKKFQGKKS